MKLHWQRYIALTAFCLQFLTSFSQIDTIFWFAAPEVSASAGESPIYLRFLTYDDPASITVSLPANGSFTPINLSIPANDNDSINLTPFLSSIESPAANAVSNNGIKIVSDYPISAFYELKSSSHKEHFSLKGNKALGTNFYTPFQTFWNNGSTTPASFSSIDIVASEDNTTVLITPRTAIVGHAQDVTFSITLNAGQTYSARDMNVTGASSLKGSIVSSNNPIAITLFSGALVNSGCTSAVGDQITNTQFAGKNFIVHKGTGNSDRVYILGIQNGTNITVTNSGTTSSLINWGETFEVPLSDAINYIQTSKPVYVWHVSGYGCELSGAQVPNVYCAGTYKTAFTRTTSDSIGLILYTRTGYENQFTLNGSNLLVPGGAFTTVPGTSGEFKVAKFFYSTAEIPVHSYNIIENSGDIFGMGVIAGNNGSGSSYSYLSEFTSYPFIDAGIDDTICANTDLSLSGNLGGGSVTGVWSTSGFGTFSSSPSTLVNTYQTSPLDSLISPIKIILTTTGPCPVLKDTIFIDVEPAPIVSASADQSVCANNSVVSLSGSVAGGASTGQWSTLGSGTFAPDEFTLDADYIPSNADITNGSVQLVLTSTNNGSCLPETDTMQITITQGATVDAGADTLYTCVNNPQAALNGTVSGVTSTGKWTSSGSGVFSPDNLTLNASYQPSPQDLTLGSVWLTLESTSNGNCVPVYDSLLLIFTPSPVVDAGANQLVCNNESMIDLSGSISGATTTGVWSGGSGIFNPNSTSLVTQYTPTASEVSSGTLFLTLTSTNNGGCVAVNDVVQINFIAPPFANFGFTETCQGGITTFNDFSLNGYGAVNSWNWDFGDSNTSNSQNNTHTYANYGTYDVQLIVTSTVGCSDTIIQQVQSFEKPIADFTFTSDCPNNQIIIDFTDASSCSTGTINYWFYDFGGQGNSSVQNPTQLFSSNGNYNVTHIVGTADGCYDTISQVVTVPPLPIADFSYNLDNSSNVVSEVYFIDNSQNAVSYIWDFGNGTISTNEDPNVIYDINGNYLVTLVVTSALGCIDSTSEIVIIDNIVTEEEIATIIPNAISPNDDGKNDVWKLNFIAAKYPNAYVQIFNEWGQLIFDSQGYAEPWDGKYRGDFVPDGTYYYVIDLDSNSSADDLLKGTILVLKSKN